MVVDPVILMDARISYLALGVLPDLTLKSSSSTFNTTPFTFSFIEDKFFGSLNTYHDVLLN
ncbi:MAG: hypothetical protein AAGC64_10915 [Bacteroidota bacterium]